MDTVSVNIIFIQAVQRFSLLAMQSAHAIKFDSVLTEHFCFYTKEAGSSGIPNFRYSNSITSSDSFNSFS